MPRLESILPPSASAGGYNARSGVRRLVLGFGQGKGKDESGYRTEVINLVRLARSVSVLPRK